MLLESHKQKHSRKCRINFCLVAVVKDIINKMKCNISKKLRENICNTMHTSFILYSMSYLLIHTILNIMLFYLLIKQKINKGYMSRLNTDKNTMINKYVKIYSLMISQTNLANNFKSINLSGVQFTFQNDIQKD